MSRDRLSDAFHAHLDACKRCRERPFDLCAIGALLLRTAATEVGTAETAARMGDKTKVPGV